MKRLTTLLTMAITFTGLAQQMQYNPDANGDDFVGVEELFDSLTENVVLADGDGVLQNNFTAQTETSGYGFVWEVAAIHNSGELEGLITLRLFLMMENPSDFLSALGGVESEPLIIESTATPAWYNHPLGFYTPQSLSLSGDAGIDSLLLEQNPDLAFDSWLTIGCQNIHELPMLYSIWGTMSPEESLGSPPGMNIVVNDPVGGAIYVPFGGSYDENNRAFAGDDLKVLVGQFTTAGQLSGQAFVQVFQNNSQDQEFRTSFSIPPSPVVGCMDAAACNFDPLATIEGEGCSYPEEWCGCFYCDGELLPGQDPDGDGVCNNYDPGGCMLPGACNYSECSTDLTQCIFPDFGYDCSGNCLDDADGDGVCDVFEGCTNSSACNYDENALDDDGSCQYGACHCLEGTVWSAELGGCIVANPSDTDFDGCVSMTDLLDLLSVFGTCNETPWSCGDPLEYQGYDYETVQIGEQCWFAENLRSENYLNGDAILSSLSGDEWSTVNVGAVSTFGEGESNCYNYSPNGDACNETWALSEYGRLYNWHATIDDRGLCPTDWHVSSDSDWLLLMEFLGGSFDAEMAMKTTTGWSNSGDGSNSSGFSGLPGGQRSNNLGNFNLSGTHGYWWSSSTEGMDAVGYYLSNLNEGLIRFAEDPRYGSSVRCIKDTE